MFEGLWWVLGFVVMMSILVCFHEFGHYWVARRLGVKVLRFSLGWGKPIRSYRTRDGVEWSIAPFPVGGYVKMLDEREGPVAPHERHLAFNNQSVPKRMAILVAGPLFNFILAIALFWAVYVIGVVDMKPVLAAPPQGSAAAKAGIVAGDEVLKLDGDAVPTWSDLQGQILDLTLNHRPVALTLRSAEGVERPATLDFSQVRTDPQFLFDDLGLSPYQPIVPALLKAILPGTAAESAGFKAGDRLLSRDGIAIASWQDWAQWVAAHPGAVARIGIDRDGQPLTLNLIVGRNPKNTERGLFGAEVQSPEQLWQHLRALKRLDPLAAVPAAALKTWQTTELSLRMMWRIVTGEVSVKNISGPIGIAEVAGYAIRAGLVKFLSLMAFVSVSLGVLNLMPVPLLDGGHLLLYAIEGVRRRPLSERIVAVTQYVGFAFIGVLMVLALYNDIMRQI